AVGGGGGGGAASAAVLLTGASASRRCGLKGGMFAERSETVSDRLPAMRTNGRTRTTSWLPTRLIVETRITCRANVGSSAVGRRSPLWVPFSAPASGPPPSHSPRCGSADKFAPPAGRRKTAAPLH